MHFLNANANFYLKVHLRIFRCNLFFKWIKFKYGWNNSLLLFFFYTGLFVYTYPISTVLNETSAACLQNETISSMFNLRFHHRSINYIDCVTKNGDILYVFANDYLYIHDIGTNPTAVEWKSNSANNPFKSTNHTPYPHEVDACAKADSQKMLFFSGENNLIFEFSNNLGFWSQRNQTMCWNFFTTQFLIEKSFSFFIPIDITA